MKRLLIILMLTAMPASAQMRVLEIPVTAICWDSLEEVIDHHKKTLSEYPIIKLYSDHENGGALLVNPDNTNWTFVAFKTHPVTKKTVACAFFIGTAWSIVKPPEPDKDTKNDEWITL